MGNDKDSVPRSQLTGNIHRRLKDDHPRVSTKMIELTKSIVVLTVCLVIPDPEATYLRIP